ncbi:MAG: DUF748 domain-containing protein [Candidatus Loosdrechtia sp.]|uniref:DUF748 domain-containing protein n=1 Tax=Candidatus Loosdrechtia sp. TaxID=3101272 RepID=UPI003A6E20A2|nr:MAG: DUF748 domain-containing protein [Candidatus Jettenia sp. AMX2]
MLPSKPFFRFGSSFASWSWPARVIVIGCFLISLYAVVGFFVLPPLVKTQVIKKLSAYTGRNVDLNKLHMNPFTLSVTLRDFALYEKNASQFMRFEDIYINFQISSLFRRAYTFSKIRLTSPHLHIIRQTDGSFNFQDLLAPSGENNGEKQGGLPPLLIHHLFIDSAHLVFEDYTRSAPFMEKVEAFSFSLHHFTTRPHREGLYEFEATTGRGAMLKYRGNISVIPLYSKGSMELTRFQLDKLWAYLQEQLDFEITTAEADVWGMYEFSFTEGKPELRLQDSRVLVRSLSIMSKEDGAEVIILPILSFDGVNIDYQRQEINIDLIQSDSAKIHSVLEKDGNFNLQKIFPVNTTGNVSATHHMDQAEQDRWQISINKIDLADYAITMKDQTTIPTAHLDLSPLDLKIEGLRFGMPGEARIELQTGVNQTGIIQVAGTVLPEPPTAGLDVQLVNVALMPFQPYLHNYAKLEIREGDLSLGGYLSYAKPGMEQNIHFSGDIRIVSTHTADSVFSKDIIRWELLDIKQVTYTSNPALLSIQEVVANGFFTNIVIGPDGTANIQHILRKDNFSAEETHNQLQDNKMLILIDQVTIKDSAMNFADFSLEPNFVAGIQELNGTVKGLSSEQLARADIDLTGMVDNYAPVVIQGKINPLSEEAYTDITMNFRNIELTTFSPYSAKFAGYQIEKGKLSLELHYKLSEKILKGENHIILDQFTFGERVDSPDATTLPVRLAIAILKDSRGVIDVNLPVRGDLNNPQFRLGPLLMRAFVNLVVRATMSPFSMLAALVGAEGESLEFVVFVPGSSVLSQEQQSKLAKIARALEARPQLILNLRGIAAAPADLHALAEQAILSHILTNQRIHADRSLSETEQRRLFNLYLEMFEKEDPYDLVPHTDSAGVRISRDVHRDAVISAAIKRLIEKYPVSEGDLRKLAQARAAKIKDYLIQQGGLSESRIFLLEVDTKAHATDNEVRMPLVLGAR